MLIQIFQNILFYKINFTGTLRLKLVQNAKTKLRLRLYQAGFFFQNTNNLWSTELR